MKQLIFLIADRINVIGVENYLALIDILWDCGIRAISLDQHSSGGMWDDKHILQVKTVLDYCRQKGMDVYLTIHDLSKCDYGSPNGLYVTGGRPHTPVVKRTNIDKNRVQFEFLVMPDRVYQVSFEASREVIPHLFDSENEDWQLIKWGKSERGNLEFRSAKNQMYHRLIFVAEKNIQQLTVNMPRPKAVSDLTTLRGLDEYSKLHLRAFECDGLWYYRGGEGVSGTGFCRTPNFNDRPARLEAYRNTVGRAAKEYAEFIGSPIVGARIEADEFSYLGGLWGICDGADMVQEMKTLGAMCYAFFGPTLIDARPQDFQHPSRNNAKYAFENVEIKDIGNGDGLIPIAWAEETTPALCAENKELAADNAIGGIYLTRSNPQDWRGAGFSKAAIYFYPNDVERPDGARPTYLDVPQDKLSEIVQVFS